jgi:hypothetical protein
MIANRPQIDGSRPPARLLRAGLFVDGRPLPGIADGVGHNGAAVDTHQHRPVYVAY